MFSVDVTLMLLAEFCRCCCKFSTFSQLSLPDFRRLISMSLNETRYIFNGDIRSELQRAERISSDSRQTTSKEKVKNRLINNGYPVQELLKVESSPIDSRTKEMNNYKSYIKIPFFSKKQRREIISLHKRTALDKRVRLIVTTQRHGMVKKTKT